VDSAGYARSVREDTAELASYVLSDKKDKRSASFLTQRASGSSFRRGPDSSTPSTEAMEDGTIVEVSEPSSPDTAILDSPHDGPSMLTSLLRHSPPKTDHGLPETEDQASMENGGRPTNPTSASSQRDAAFGLNDEDFDVASERTPLLRTKSAYSQPPDSPELSEGDDLSDIESQKPRPRSRQSYSSARVGAKDRIRAFALAMNPKTWDGTLIWQQGVLAPVRCLPAVVVGLLLNILDALSYGKYQSGWYVKSSSFGLTSLSRYDLVSSREPRLCQPRTGWYFDILR
jgi:SulP family sulfate permease